MSDVSVFGGDCPVCRQRVRVHRGIWVRSSATGELERSIDELGEDLEVYRIESHGSTDGPNYRCPGSGMLPLEDRILEGQRRRAKEKRDADLRARLDVFRQHAAVALDAFEWSKPYPQDDLRVLLRVSAFEYRRYFPESRAVAPLRYVPFVGARKVKSKSGDCYCTFCGELIDRGVRNTRFGALLTDDLIERAMRSPHAIRCALTHLVHGHKPAEPGVKKLPDEYVIAEGAEA